MRQDKRDGMAESSLARQAQAVIRCGTMTTLTIELADEAARIAAEEAHRAYMTLSEWIGIRIAGRRRVRSAAGCDALGYPTGWFERSCGGLADVEDFRDPADPPAAPVALLEP